MESGVWVWVPVISVSGFYITIALIVWTVTKARQRRAEMQAEVQTRMIDKFSSAPEFVAFLQSDAGKHFASTFEEVPRAHARDRILGGVTRSVVLTVLGLGFLAICLTEARDTGFIIAGCILLALGLGYFIATIASFRLSKSWGLLPNADQDVRP
jgi:hypothetical protein